MILFNFGNWHRLPSRMGKNWVGQKVYMVFSIKYTFFIFASSFIDLDILSMSAVSCVVEH